MTTKGSPWLALQAAGDHARTADATPLPPLAFFCLALLAAVSFKFFLAAQIGPETYLAAVATMAEGGWAERAPPGS
ncbi:MAG: hypothetical protein QNJ44_01055 [Rhodobacter sp.]|nr:hypothetical protein [Rhodobacter sp.]